LTEPSTDGLPDASPSADAATESASISTSSGERSEKAGTAHQRALLVQAEELRVRARLRGEFDFDLAEHLATTEAQAREAQTAAKRARTRATSARTTASGTAASPADQFQKADREAKAAEQ